MNDIHNIDQNPDKEKNDISFEIKENVNIVSGENKKNNKTPVIIIVAFVIIVLVSSVIFLFVTKDDNKNQTEDGLSTTVSDSNDYDALENAFNSESFTDEEGNSISGEEYKEYVQNIVSEATTTFDSEKVSNAHSIVEITTSSEDEKTELPYNKEKCELIIKAFLNRSCYFEGAISDINGISPVAIAFDSDNFEMLTNFDGTEVSIVKIDGKIYFKRTALKQYTHLTDFIMQTFGFSVDMVSFDFGDNNYDSMKDQLTSITPVTVDGKDGVCFRYDKDNGFFNFYFVNDELAQLDIGNNGEIKSHFVISYFSSAIPGDMLSFKGYKETGFISLFADYM